MVTQELSPEIMECKGGFKEVRAELVEPLGRLVEKYSAYTEELSGKTVAERQKALLDRQQEFLDLYKDGEFFAAMTKQSRLFVANDGNILGYATGPFNEKKGVFSATATTRPFNMFSPGAPLENYPILTGSIKLPPMNKVEDTTTEHITAAAAVARLLGFEPGAMIARVPESAKKPRAKRGVN